METASGKEQKDHISEIMQQYDDKLKEYDKNIDEAFSQILEEFTIDRPIFKEWFVKRWRS